MGGCPSAAQDHELCVGVQAEMFTGIDNVRITTTTPEGPKTETVTFAQLPHETWAHSLRDDPELSVKVEGLDSANNVVMVRTARAPMPITSPVPSLLRIRLSALCFPPGGPTCTAPEQTCIAGRCQDDHLLPSDLETYTPQWATDVPDICRPANAGPPEVIVGTGQTDYLPLMTGQVVQAEKGPQGGHHLYIALRQKNLHRSGSTTTITAVRPDTMVDIPPTAFVFTFDQDEGGYCKLYGLRYQLDNGGIDYTQFLDQDLDITVTVRDSSGTVGKGTVRVHVSPTIIGGP
jgi:hypothetical protein